MLVPQAMAYALLAGLPPEVGLYAATAPIVVYALFGSSRQLAVGPVAIVSLLSASGLAPLVEEGTSGYLAAAAALAFMVGVIHLVFGVARLGFVVNLLSHPVLIGFTAGVAVIIGFSQAKHLLGISIVPSDHFYEVVLEVFTKLGQTHVPTASVGVVALATLLGLKRFAPRLPAALIVVSASIVVVEVFNLQSSGVAVVGNIPDTLPAFGLPNVDSTLIRSLMTTALVVTVVGFVESIAVAKVYARRHRHEVNPNNELVGLGAANLAASLSGGFPVAGGFSRTAVNDAAGARTQLASLVSAAVVVVTILFLTPLFSSLPNAALAAIILTAVISLVDVAEMRHIAKVKRSNLVGLVTAFLAPLLLGIEIGIAVAIGASLLVVVARMSRPHAAVLGYVEGTMSYRDTDLFPEAVATEGVRIVRVDASMTFVSAVYVKKLVLGHARSITSAPRVLVLDASGVNDIDATGVATFEEMLKELDYLGITIHLSHVKGPVCDVLQKTNIWADLGARVHPTTYAAVKTVSESRSPSDQRRNGNNGYSPNGISEVSGV